MDERYLLLLAEYRSITRQLEGRIKPSTERTIRAQLQRLEDAARSSPAAGDNDEVPVKIREAVQVLDSVLQLKVRRTYAPIDWEGHTARVLGVVGPWPPKRNKLKGRRP